MFDDYDNSLEPTIIQELFSNSRFETLGLPINRIVYDMNYNNNKLDMIIEPLKVFDNFNLVNKVGTHIMSGIPFYAVIHHNPEKTSYNIKIILDILDN